MNVFRYLVAILIMSIIMMMQACGSGSSGIGADTSGSLTMTKPTTSDRGDGTFDVSTTITYAPPAGKSAQGVKIKTIATDKLGAIGFDETTLTGSNSFTLTFNVSQFVGDSNYVSIESSIGGMTASVGVTIPAFTFPALAVPNPTVTFADTALANDTLPVIFTGGTADFAVISSDPNIGAAVTTTNASLSGGGTITITLLTANPAGVSTPATVTLTDSTGAFVLITVNYLK